MSRFHPPTRIWLLVDGIDRSWFPEIDGAYRSTIPRSFVTLSGVLSALERIIDALRVK